MKKIFALLISLVLTSSVFAAGYADYLQQAKTYESQKKWCHALDAYYSAIITDIPVDKKAEAYMGYKKLSEAIIKGNPGLDEYGVFELYDAWKDLLIDAEITGAGNSTYDYYFSDLCEHYINYENKTGNYYAYINCVLSDRYKKTIGVVQAGYITAYQNEWNELPYSFAGEWKGKQRPEIRLEDWDQNDYDSGKKVDYKSMETNEYFRDYNNSKFPSIFEYRNTYCRWPMESVKTKTKYKDRYVLDVDYFWNKWSFKAGAKYETLKKQHPTEAVIQMNPFAGFAVVDAFSGQGGTEYLGGEVPYGYAKYYMGLYDLKFNIVDKNGKELVKGKRISPVEAYNFNSWLTEDGYSYGQIVVYFKDVPASVVTKIQKKQAFPNFVSAYLDYGKLNFYDYYTLGVEDARAWIRKLPEVEIPRNKVNAFYRNDDWYNPDESKNPDLVKFNEAKKCFKDYDAYLAAQKKADEDKLAAKKAEEEKLAAKKAEDEKLAAKKLEEDMAALEALEKLLAKEKPAQKNVVAATDRRILYPFEYADQIGLNKNEKEKAQLSYDLKDMTVGGKKYKVLTLQGKTGTPIGDYASWYRAVVGGGDSEKVVKQFIAQGNVIKCKVAGDGSNCIISLGYCDKSNNWLFYDCSFATEKGKVTVIEVPLTSFVRWDEKGNQIFLSEKEISKIQQIQFGVDLYMNGAKRPEANKSFNSKLLEFTIQ